MRTIIISVAFFLFVSCDPDLEKMTVIKDCTGVYLRSGSGADYKVCNENELSSYSNGDNIKVKFDQLEECFGLLNQPSCVDEHPYNSKIEVTEIK